MKCSTTELSALVRMVGLEEFPEGIASLACWLARNSGSGFSHNHPKQKFINPRASKFLFVRMVGLEPTSLAAHAPQACAYANSATSARLNYFSSFASGAGSSEDSAGVSGASGTAGSSSAIAAENSLFFSLAFLPLAVRK